MHYQKFLYIFFVALALNLSFFSTKNVNAKAFFIDEIQISEKLENNFNKDILINKGFKKAFKELMNTLVKSKDLAKINNISMNEIKSMIETFSIKEEKFIQKTYNLNLGVSFNKKKIFKYLSSKNIFPTQIFREKFLFIPVIIDQFNTDLLVFSNNPIYKNWKKVDKKSFLIEYILPTEDLEDFNLIKKNYSELENYNFDEIIKKYFLNHSIIALIFKDDHQIKVLSKINIKDKQVIKSNTFEDIDFDNEENLISLIENVSIILLISFMLISLVLAKSPVLTKVVINSLKAFLKPLFIRISLLKLFSNFSDICISSIKKALAFTFIVEKKDKFRARVTKKIYKNF